MRGRIRQHRALIPFHARLQVALDNGQFWELARVVYRSPKLSVEGFSHVEAFVTFTVVADPNPTGDIAFIWRLIQTCGSVGSPGPVVAIGQMPGLVGKAYQGTGTYAVPLVSGGSGQTQEGLSLGAYIELAMTGAGRGRTIDLLLDGTITAGAVR